MSRLAHRLQVVSLAVARRLGGTARRRPASPQRILIAHQLLLGDTLMTTGLIARLRAMHPQAELVMAMPPAFVPLYEGRPFGLRAVGFKPILSESFAALREVAGKEGFDWALLPGDNRFSWLAQSLGARWITGWANDQPATKNWLVDDPRPWPVEAGSLVDLWADLVPAESDSAESAASTAFSASNWPAPAARPFDRPAVAYAVLHVGASNPRKFWPAASWVKLGQGLEASGLAIVLSGGKGEEALAEACNPGGRWLNLAGRLDLAQMWNLLQGAKLLVAPDTGIAHLAKLTGTPTMALFGAGPTPLYARGRYFQHQPFHCAVMDELPARPQKSLFKREFPWLPALSATRHSQSDIHYGTGPDRILELLRETGVHP